MLGREVWEIEGGAPLRGEIPLQGAKNGALPILAATVLARGPCLVRNVPRLSDTEACEAILRRLGAVTEFRDGTFYSDTAGISACTVPEELMRTMRSSVFFLGAILGATGSCEMSLPGGCPLGARPIDLHLGALRALGVRIEEHCGHIIAQVEHPHPAELSLPYPSVGATENILLFASSLCGETRLHNAAREPEIENLAAFLRRMGARISGAGTSEVRIRGTKPLRPAEIRVLPDRICAATYLCAGVATGGDLYLSGAEERHILPVCDALRAAGAQIESLSGGLRVRAAGLHGGILTRTAPYPAFPTDAQAPLMAALLRAKGESAIEETVFERRFGAVPGFCAMGADVRLAGRCAHIRGVPALHGARVRATDLRGGAALCIAALTCEGKSQLSDVYHIDRGYQNMVQYLNRVGASVRRLPVESD